MLWLRLVLSLSTFLKHWYKLYMNFSLRLGLSASQEDFHQEIMMPPRELFNPLTSVCFQRKTEFSVSKNLYLARSKYFRPLEPENHSQVNVWNLRPPDFSLKLYTTVSPPQKKERNFRPKVTRSESMRTSTIILPSIYLSEENNKKTEKEPPTFITRYKPPDALETQVMFVRTGKFPTQQYENPRPHDFRGVSVSKWETHWFLSRF